MPTEDLTHSVSLPRTRQCCRTPRFHAQFLIIGRRSLPVRRGSRNGYNMGHVPMSPMSQSYDLHHAPKSILEHCSDHQSDADSMTINSSVSLLAQQLEAQAAMARDSRAVFDANSTFMDSAHAQQGRSAYTTQAPMYIDAPAQGGYYSTYAPAHGHHHMQSNSYDAPNVGSAFNPGSDQRVPMHMHQQQYGMALPQNLHHNDVGYPMRAPSDLGGHQQWRPSFEEMQRASQAAFTFPNACNRGVSMQ